MRKKKWSNRFTLPFESSETCVSNMSLRAKRRAMAQAREVWNSPKVSHSPFSSNVVANLKHYKWKIVKFFKPAAISVGEAEFRELLKEGCNNTVQCFWNCVPFGRTQYRWVNYLHYFTAAIHHICCVGFSRRRRREQPWILRHKTINKMTPCESKVCSHTVRIQQEVDQRLVV